jgi:GDP-L-fucose synthase
MDVSKMKSAGWQASTNLEDGIEKTYKWFLQNSENYKQVKL